MSSERGNSQSPDNRVASPDYNSEEFNSPSTAGNHNSERGENPGKNDVSGWSSANTRTSTRKKKQKKIYSIEEVFNEVSVITSSNINPPPARVVLTPRSAEVCLKLGLNPEILKIRDIDSFWESGIDPSVQRMRHEAYVQRRYEMIKQCRLERRRLMNAEFNKSTDLSPSPVMNASSSEITLRQQNEANATLIENEKIRLEKLRRRQEKELDQMLQYELNRVKLQKEVEKRMEESKKIEAMRRKQQEKRLKLMAEERRLRELQKAAMAEAEEAHARAVAREIFERERAAAEEQARRTEAQREAIRKEEEERRQRHEEHKIQVQRFFAEEQMELRRRLENLNIAEKRKEKAILKRQSEQKKKMAEKRSAIEERIERNIQMAEEVEQKRKNDFLRRQEEFEETRQKHLERLEAERNLRQQEQELQDQRRRMIAVQQRREEEKKKHQLLQKFEEEQEHVETVQEIRQREVELMKERKNLRMQMKAENVNRVMRVIDYKALGTLKKIEENDKRTNQMFEQRTALIDQRKRAAAQARLQKEAMIRAMDKLRSDAAQADKVIKKALTGKVSLSAIISVDRATSAKSGKRKTKKSKSTSELLGVHRTTKSAGDAPDPNSNMDMHSHYSYGKTNSSTGQDAPLPYVSPYDSTFKTTTSENERVTM